MDDRLKQLEIKKLLTEYDYLNIDGEIKQEIIDKYKPVFMEDLKEYDDPNKEKTVEENVGEPMNMEKVVEKLIKDEDLSDHTKKRMKKMFRDVMKKTHPDKVKSEELVEIYIKSKEAYELNDLLSLSHYANKLNIEVRLNVVEIKILKDLLSKKKESLEVIESSWLWLWYNSKTKEAKTKVVELYYEKHIKQ
tara:strand:+ start:15293 stop:15868 length:576 start_codon:yes stop_codon:yes gene_type:complete